MSNTNDFIRKRTLLYIVLCAIFLTNAVLAEIIGVKIFSLENSFGLESFGWKLLGYQLDFNLTAGAIIWPVVFITTDIINEYFGKRGVRRISIITAILIVYTFVIIYLVTELSPAKFWTDLYAPLEINSSFAIIFRQGLGIIIGSIVAFLIGQLLDAYVFHYLKKLTGNKRIWVRATGSTLVSQLIDSYVVLFVAFYLFGAVRWPIEQVIAVGTINYVYKFSVAILLTPVLYLSHYLIDNYLGKESSAQLIKEAEDSYEQAKTAL